MANYTNDMQNTELAEVIDSVDMFELAAKTTAGMSLTDDETAAVEVLDKTFKEIGKRGCDSNNEIAAFISRVINEEIYNAPDELLDQIFDRDSIGENDDYYATTNPKNTFIAYEAAKGGNVERSFLDISTLTPTWRNFQIETDISYADIRRNGWKTVARITDYALATFTNKQFAEIFSVINTLVTSGADNYITEATTKPTQATMDALALYLNDRGGGVIVGLSKYIQAASKLTGFVSDEMRNEVHRTGRLGSYDGCEMFPISSAKKLGDGSLQIPDHALYGIAGKIGTLTTKGEVNVYEDMNNNKEQIHLKFADFTFGYAIGTSQLENIVKVAIA